MRAKITIHFEQFEPCWENSSSHIFHSETRPTAGTGDGAQRFIAEYFRVSAAAAEKASPDAARITRFRCPAARAATQGPKGLAARRRPYGVFPFVLLRAFASLCLRVNDFEFGFCFLVFCFLVFCFWFLVFNY